MAGSGGRRPGNLLGLTVLGVLQQRPMHPYEMAAVLREFGKDTSIKIKWGSLYTVVQGLEKRGLIEAAGTTRQGGRPERTIYRITDAGRQEADEWLRDLLGTPEREYTRFEAALSLMGIIPPDDVVRLLESRLRRLEGELAAERAAWQSYATTVPRIFLVEGEYHQALLEAEARWVRELIRELDSGTFSGLAEWRHFHETGELPDVPGMPPLGKEGAPQT